MNESFDMVMYKSWGVRDDCFIYGNKEIPYEDITMFNLASSAGVMARGLIQFTYKGDGKVRGCYFTYSDRVRATKAYQFVQEKIAEANGQKKDYLYKLTAHTGSYIEVYKDYLVIAHMGVGTVSNVMRGGVTGAKRINYTDLTSIQFREPSGAAVGFIQVIYPGSIESKGGVLDMINDENSVPVMPCDTEYAREIVNYIERRKVEIESQPNASNVPAVSVADEILKFKNLLDSGIITQEEFDKKKSELLN